MAYWHLSRVISDKTLMPIVTCMSLHDIINGLRFGGHSIPRAAHHGGEFFFKIWKQKTKLTRLLNLAAYTQAVFQLRSTRYAAIELNVLHYFI